MSFLEGLIAFAITGVCGSVGIFLSTWKMDV
jgi:hypothetical protein